MIFKLTDFPKFKDAHLGKGIPWHVVLHNDGYQSAICRWRDGKPLPCVEMDDIEYTHFVLKWS
jgi:hypothetical protein